MVFGSGPFGGDPLGYGTHWLAYNNPKDGGKSIGDSVQLGEQNDLGRTTSPPKVVEGATIVTIQYGSNNAVLAALSGGGNPPDKGPGGVGVFGQSVAGGIDETKVTLPLPVPTPPVTAGIGVAGHCNTGCGVYGQSIFGAGVAGFASTRGWGNRAPITPSETPPNPVLPPTFRQAGVLGVSEFGPGVRGHGSTLLPPGDPLANPNCEPGGVFSSGSDLEFVDVGAGRRTQDLSKKNSPQLRLVPFQGGSGALLPLKGMVGDFFFTFNSSPQQPGPVPVAELFICLSIVPLPNPEDKGLPGIPVWFKVNTFPGIPGGTPIP